MGVAPGCARQFTPGGRPRRRADHGRVPCDHLNVPDVTERLAARVRRDFPEKGSADDLIRRLGELSDSERIQSAIVLWAAGDLARFNDSVALAGIDWRDVLVRGGLADDDWPTRLDQELGWSEA